MKRYSFLLICMLVSLHLAAQYYPEGTKWTEIRLDTLKYDSWFSEDGTPNYEVREFYIKGQTKLGSEKYFNNVYLKRENESDSLAYYVGIDEYDFVVAAIPWHPDVEGREYCGPVYLYSFAWDERNWMQSKSMITGHFWGAELYAKFDWEDEDEKERDFGGIKPLRYVNVQSSIKRREQPARFVYDVNVIQGIGVTSWPGSDCIFGPVDALYAIDTRDQITTRYHPYRSMLIYFERNGEVLYNMQPTPASVKGVPSPSVKNDTPIYDLSGRQLQKKPTKGIYIQNGKKVLGK